MGQGVDACVFKKARSVTQTAIHRETFNPSVPNKKPRRLAQM